MDLLAIFEMRQRWLNGDLDFIFCGGRTMQIEQDAYTNFCYTNHKSNQEKQLLNEKDKTKNKRLVTYRTLVSSFLFTYLSFAALCVSVSSALSHSLCVSSIVRSCQSIFAIYVCACELQMAWDQLTLYRYICTTFKAYKNMRHVALTICIYKQVRVIFVRFLFCHFLYVAICFTVISSLCHCSVHFILLVLYFANLIERQVQYWVKMFVIFKINGLTCAVYFDIRL